MGDIGLRTRIEAGEPLVGTFLQSPSLADAELVSGLGVDFVCVEAEHSGLGRDQVQGLVGAAALVATPALVRVSGNAAVEIAAALDAGAAGVIVPRVDSAGEAAAAVRAARYPPAGTRGIGPSRATGYGRFLPEYFAKANGELAVGVQIESEEAVKAAGEIARVEGVDFVFVGPGDLAASLGVPFGDPRVDQVIDSVLAVARDRGCPAGIWAGSPQQAAQRLNAGFGLVILSSDLGFLAEGLARALGELREARG